MHKKLNKPYTKNNRIENPLGLHGFPLGGSKGAIIATGAPIIIVTSGRVTISAGKENCSIPQ